MEIPSGYWRRQYDCTLGAKIYKLYNSSFLWRHSFWYLHSKSCHTIDGTSGSPILDPQTRVVIGVNNALNHTLPHCKDARCLVQPGCRNFLCQQTKKGVISVHKHRRYGQQTWWLTTCLAANRRVDLSAPGCLLPKPQ